jgi:branched-chain amino acid transport system substrate-binding protein
VRSVVQWRLMSLAGMAAVVLLAAIAATHVSRAEQSAVGGLPSVVNQAPRTNVARIVSSLPLTGMEQATAQSIASAIRMAVDESNQRVGGLTIAYEAWDDASPMRGGWDADREFANAQRAANNPSVVAYVGPYNSGAARVAIPILNRADVVVISPSNTYPGLTKANFGPLEPEIYYPTGRRNYARVVATDDLQGVAGARWARELGAQRVYVLDDGDRYGGWLAAAFHQEAHRLNLQVYPSAWPDTIDPRTDDYRELAQRIRASGPDLVYFGGTYLNNAARLWQDLRDAFGPGVKLMGPDGLYEQAFLDAAGTAARETYLTINGRPIEQYEGRAREWLQRYRTRFGADPDPWAIYGYESANVVLDAIARVGQPNRAAIRDAVMATRDYDGVLGRWSLDANGDTTLTRMSGLQVRGPTIAQAAFVTALSVD